MSDVAPEVEAELPVWASMVTGAVAWDKPPTPGLPGQPVSGAPQPGQVPGTGMGQPLPTPVALPPEPQAAPSTKR